MSTSLPMVFSIIIPHHETAAETDPLLPTLASIIDQEGVKVELILQHGGGVLGLWGKLSRLLNLSAKKEQVTLRVIEETSSSPFEALAMGIKRATGTWIGFLQPGEQYLPGALMSITTAFQEHPDIDVFLTGSISSKLTLTPAILPSVPYLKNRRPAWPSHSLFCRTSLLRETFLLEPSYQHQMVTAWLLQLLQAGKKIEALPILTTFTSNEEKQKESLQPKTTGIALLLKPWQQWRHQTAVSAAKKLLTLPSPLLVYQSPSLSQRTSSSVKLQVKS